MYSDMNEPSYLSQTVQMETYVDEVSDCLPWNRWISTTSLGAESWSR